MARTRDPGLAQHRFHSGLVAYVERGLQIHAIKAEHFACVRHWHLQLFQRSNETLYSAQLLAEPAYGIDQLCGSPTSLLLVNQLLGIECVLHLPMPVEVLFQFRRQSISRLSRDDGQAYARQSRGGEDETRGCGKQKRCDEGSDHHGQDATR